MRAAPVLFLLLLLLLSALKPMAGQKDAFLGGADSYGYGFAREDFDRLFAKEIGPRLGANEHYFDYTGTSLYWNSQLTAALDELGSAVFGNPHSTNPSAMRTEGGVEELRAALLAFFGAQPEDYYLVFTRSGSGALHLVGETFPWSPASSFSYLTVNHNSVLGIRDVARQRGAAFGAVDEESVKAWLADPSATPPQLQHHQQQPQERSAAQQRRLLREPQLQEPQQEPTYSLFAYPSYDNFAGTLYPLEWVRRVQAKSTADHRWLVLLDAAAYVPSHPLNLTETPADFVPISFYKLFGYPSGVGALLVRREAAALLRKLYWGGGATFLATSTLDWLSWFDPPSRFEDGTLPFLNILALRYGLAVYDRLGGPAAVLRHVDAVGTWMYRQLAALRHSNGAPLLHIFGRHGHPNSTLVQGQTINLLVLKPSGEVFSYKRAAAELAAAGFHIRTGCTCNPGSCYGALGLRDEEVADLAEKMHGNFSEWEWIWVERDTGTSGSRISVSSLRAWLSAALPARRLVRVPLGSVRFSLGMMSRFEDAKAAVDFLAATFTDREDDSSGGQPPPPFYQPGLERC